MFDRKNFVGHITGSAIIFDYKNSKVLLIKHIILQRWLQPGGHIEKTDASILDGVYREIFEETNIAKDDLMLISPIFGKKFPHRHRLASHPRESGQTRKTTLSSRPPLFFYLQRRKDHGRKRKLKVEWCIQFIQPGHLPEISKKIWDLLDIDLNTRLFYENIHLKGPDNRRKLYCCRRFPYHPRCRSLLRAIDTIVPIQTIVPQAQLDRRKDLHDRSEGF